jgi:trehalose-phosphatase
MQSLDNTFDLDSFHQALRSDARRRILFLDYDGTLAPFTPDRDRAKPYEGVCDMIRRIQSSGRTRVVIVSGRSLDDLPDLIGLKELPELWGSHGWEHRTVSGVYSRGEVPVATVSAMEQAVELVRSQGLHSYLETKPVSVALHWRGASERDGASISKLAEQWREIAQRAVLDLHAFDGGVELRVFGRNKAHAVRHVLEEEPNRGPVAYLGDDETDEEAFSALGSGDLGVLVRQELRPTRAKIWLRPPHQLLDFFAQWP